MLDRHFKDEILDDLAEKANVAQFVSFSPDLSQRFIRVGKSASEVPYASIEWAISAVMESSDERSVNVRSFLPDNPKSREFVYGIRSVDEAAAHVRRLAADGSYTIVNETIDVRDGGVSGVALGNIIEFAPEDTPRCVEKPGVVSLKRSFAYRLIETVYGFRPTLPGGYNSRIEFSLHPIPRGLRNSHTIVWEVEDVPEYSPPDDPPLNWPNRFSEFVGDKAYGLLIGSLAGLQVPRATVFPRRLAPFHFGDPTGTAEPWIRTCPTRQQPGRYTTKRGWTDPFLLMHEEDPSGEQIAAVLSQEGVAAKWSGALITTEDGSVQIDAVQGWGDDFMLGRRGPEALPDAVRLDVLAEHAVAVQEFGPVRMEWAHDGSRAWILQLHVGATPSHGLTVFPGAPKMFHRFEVHLGIEQFRDMIDAINPEREGIILVGNIGITSHFGDLLRKARIPSKIERPR